MYARGILFGQMKYELGDVSVVRCPELGLSAEIEFKTKGWVSGTYNSIGGTIRNDETGEALFELSGLWSEEMYVKDLRVSRSSTKVLRNPLRKVAHVVQSDWSTRHVFQRHEGEAFTSAHPPN